MAEERSRDLVLTSTQYAYILDSTKGIINCYVGPTKMSPSNTDEPVIFSEKAKTFVPCSLEQVKQNIIIAPENWYVVLKNPEKTGKHPKTNSDVFDLDIGKKINIIGATNFALFPGQMAKVIRGHVLRSNQYLLVRVYNAEGAQENWNQGIVKSTNDEAIEMTAPLELVNGQVMVIKGTDISFYIPPTGIEVLCVDGHEGRYIREAVTLERLEYCVLKDENGDKRYVQGPDVVFPEPTEQFILNQAGEYKYRAYELNEISGIYVKVVADYEEGDRKYKIGEELFLTGKDVAIYIPRPEHAIISYGDQTIHYAIAIPEGEGRYVLNRLTGNVDTVVGPTMLLPDPRTQVIVKRILSPSQTNLWFPGNKKVAAYNDRLRESLTESTAYLTTMDFSNSITDALSMNTLYSGGGGETAISRKASFTKPRTITLQTDDYDGVVSIDVWTGYSVKVVDKVGNSKVIVGPTTYLMGYNESLEVMELSSGKPKTTDSLVKTVFLRAKNNKVSDIIPVETKDFCIVNVKVSYNVEFTGNTADEQLKWFDSDNYVKLLCDRMKSKIRREVKKLTIEEFCNNAADVITNIVLGDDHQGTFFIENNMRIFDIEVITVTIQDRDINELFEKNQYDTIQKQLELTNAETKTTIAKRLADFDKVNAQTKFDIESENLRLKRELEAEKAKLNQFIFDKERELTEAKLAAEKSEREEQNAITHLKLEADKAISAVKLTDKERNNALDRMMIDAASKSFTEKMSGITPGLIEAMNALANAGLTAEVAKAIAPYALAADDESVADVVRKLKLDKNSLEGIMSMFKQED